MKRLIGTLFLLGILLLSACGSDLSEGDQEACDMYSSTVELADEGKIEDDEMIEEFEEAFYVAESDQLVDLLDDLLIYLEDEEGDLQETVNSIKVYCSLD